jgi:hypothetical protein
MHGSNYDKLYDRLKPQERLTLYIEAMARDDAAESSRVESSCPRSNWTGPDPRFHQRLTMAFDVMAVVTIDLRCMWGKLHLLHWVMEQVVPEMTTALHITAGLGFIEGEHCGQGLPQIHFFSRPLPKPREASDEEFEQAAREAEGEDDEDFGDEDREQPKWHQDRGQRLHAVEKRAQHFTACGKLSLMLAARDTAQDMVNTWEAFGAFCRTRVGVTAETMLAAWGFPVAGDFEETLKRYAHLKPQAEKVRDYTRSICINWDRMFSPGHGFDADAGSDAEADTEPDDHDEGRGDGE